MASTVRFLQEENQRLLDRTEELLEENEHMRVILKSLRGLLGTVAKVGSDMDLNSLLPFFMRKPSIILIILRRRVKATKIYTLS